MLRRQRQVLRPYLLEFLTELRCVEEAGVGKKSRAALRLAILLRALLRGCTTLNLDLRGGAF